MKLRYKLIDVFYGLWLEVERGFLWLVLRILPKVEPEDPELCDHNWFVDEVDYQSVSLLLKCWECCSDGAVRDPSKEEWDRAYGVGLNNYEWHDNQRVEWIQQWSD